jgi:hypothetical protein
VESLAKTDADEEIELSMKNLKQKKTLAQAILWFWVKLFVSNRESILMKLSKLSNSVSNNLKHTLV